MMKEFRVRSHELWWHECYYTVEANSKEEARAKVELELVNPEQNIFESVDKCNVEEIEEAFNEEI